jgi:hypothetical protein
MGRRKEYSQYYIDALPTPGPYSSPQSSHYPDCFDRHGSTDKEMPEQGADVRQPSDVVNTKL